MPEILLSLLTTTLPPHFTERAQFAYYDTCARYMTRCCRFAEVIHCVTKSALTYAATLCAYVFCFTTP